MSNKTPTDAGSEMWFPGLMYSEAYYWACTVDEDTAQLILHAFNSDEIDFETAKSL